MNLQRTLQEGIRLHEAGRLNEAERQYRLIISQMPKQPEALQLLGVIAHQLGRNESAVELIQEAIRARPKVAEYHNNLGQALEQLDRWPEASACYRKAIALNSSYPEVYNNLGNTLRREGRLAEAAAAQQKAIALRPQYAEAHGNLSATCADQRRFTEAIATGERALRLAGDRAEFHFNLGAVLQQSGDRPGAIRHYQRAVALHPTYVEARNGLAICLHDSGREPEALAAFDAILRIKPDYAFAHYNQGLVLKETSRLEAAAASTRRALSLNPSYADAQNLLGNIMGELGRNTAAIVAYQTAILLRSDNAGYYGNLGNAYWAIGEAKKAVAATQTAIKLDPQDVIAHINLGNARQLEGNLEAATDAYRRAIRLDPDALSAHNNLANILKDQGLLDEAIAAYRRVVAADPHRPSFHNLLFTLHYHPDYDAARLAAEHRHWREQCADRLASSRRDHPNDRRRDRRLRVGYVSTDFREHAVARFLLPLLQNHDPQQFQIFCYASVAQPDARTKQFQSLPLEWHDITGVPDTDVADLIRRHEIDLLVDLGAHTSESRITLFAHKPAPVQVTWLAYAGSTGLDTIDYRLTDPILDPPGGDESVYSETCFRLPETYWCCQPSEFSCPTNSLPALAQGSVAFGCLNNFCKISEPIKECWAQILAAVPNSSLLVHAHQGGHRERFLQFFASRGIDPSRITFVGKQLMREYFETYLRIDIALDPYPYGGGTTTCDALWMGVPVVSLRGSTAVSRAGATLLTNVGLGHLAVISPFDYVRTARELAENLPALAELRGGLRAQMLNSPLMNAPRFARHMEQAFRQMWQNWCQR